MLAFRAPDIRSVTAYSSMAQMGLVTMGLFSLNELGVDGAILQSVAHGLVSATLFLLAGMVEVRTGTSAFAGLGGMARGRPVLATLLMTTGIIALAVPGSVAFAGEFLILAGVYGVAWGWAVAGAAGIVLAAMYMLRLISAVLHTARGRDVREDAPGRAAVRAGDRRAARRACCSSSPPGRRWSRSARFPLISDGADGGGAVIPTPKVDWLALAPTLALLGASGVALLGSVLVPWWMRRFFCALVVFAGFITSGVFAAIVFDETDERPGADRGVVHPRPARCVLGADHRGRRHPRPSSSPGATGGAITSASTTRSSPRPGRAWSSSSPRRT